MTSTCFYCGGMYCHTTKQHGDHMPTPKRHGGTNIVPCCSACHDMKDRIPITDLHAEAWKEINTSWDQYGRYTRIFLAKSLSLMSDYMEKRREENSPLSEDNCQRFEVIE